ncbi:hypothetical protein WK29_24515 [Burkholderia vietnamiensis]|nr:hypothetical protein WK29_24515 [Burkholderia vietnamiensis]
MTQFTVATDVRIIVPFMSLSVIVPLLIVGACRLIIFPLRAGNAEGRIRFGENAKYISQCNVVILQAQ